MVSAVQDADARRPLTSRMVERRPASCAFPVGWPIDLAAQRDALAVAGGFAQQLARWSEGAPLLAIEVYRRKTAATEPRSRARAQAAPGSWRETRRNLVPRRGKTCLPRRPPSSRPAALSIAFAFTGQSPAAGHALPNTTNVRRKGAAGGELSARLARGASRCRRGAGTRRRCPGQPPGPLLGEGRRRTPCRGARAQRRRPASIPDLIGLAPEAARRRSRSSSSRSMRDGFGHGKSEVLGRTT